MALNLWLINREIILTTLRPSWEKNPPYVGPRNKLSEELKGDPGYFKGRPWPTDRSGNEVGPEIAGTLIFGHFVLLLLLLLLLENPLIFFWKNHSPSKR